MLGIVDYFLHKIHHRNQIQIKLLFFTASKLNHFYLLHMSIFTRSLSEQRGIKISNFFSNITIKSYTI